MVDSALLVDGLAIPHNWSVGDFQLVVSDITAGRLNHATGVFHGIAGTAWLQLPCAVQPVYTLGGLENSTTQQLSQAVEVVAEVVYPQSQIAVAEAQNLQPTAKLGDTIALPLTVEPSDLQQVANLGRGVAGWLGSPLHQAGFPVEFSDLEVTVDAAGNGHVVAGQVTYPIAARRRFPIEIVIDGFTVVISSLDLLPHRATAVAQVRLPGGMTDADSCQLATIDLGTVTMSPNCAFYIDEPNQAYGPWLLADTGLVVAGIGFKLDLSTAISPAPLPASWRGLLLGAGTASGEQYVPEPCNTGYLRGHYTYAGAVIVSSGFYGALTLAEPISFTALNPLGQTFTFDNGSMEVWQSRIAGGTLTGGSTTLLLDAVCVRQPGQPVVITLDDVSIQPDLDLTATFDYGNREISWGELTQAGHELVAWTGMFGAGYLYLPAGADESFSPMSTGAFVGPVINSIPGTSLAELATKKVAGVSFPAVAEAIVYSLDRPGGRANPIKLAHLHGWLRVGLTGVDGALSIYEQAQADRLGDPTRAGYVGKVPFNATLFVNNKQRQSLLAEFVTSASYDSYFSGQFNIPYPCDIAQLIFDQMKLTSTACLVGGELVLPSAGVPLEYWQLQLVPTGPPSQAGVVSVRTGRVLFTAAGIAEPVHFAQPFGLTWGEMLADGNLGELDLDFNNWGQRFDGLVFNPREVTLSPWVAAVTDPYLGVFGPVFFPFFGLHPVNIRDALGAPTSTSPPNPRYVTVPKTPITPHAQPTQLALAGTWHDVNSGDLAVFECPESDVDYNVSGQYGFQGTGTGVLSFLHSDPLDIIVEINSDATDIHISSSDTHDLDVGLFARLGGMAQIDGCARIEGTTLARITLYGMLEESAAAGSIFGPKAGYETEIDLAVTPTTFDFYASGDMLLSVLVDLNISATAHLLVDFAAGSAEGDLTGRVDCDAVVAGLTGQGQLTWYVGPTMQYLQGRMQVGVISLDSGALEGGFFIGNNVPKELAWVLDPSDTHFGMSRSILPPMLTGVYGYGQASISVSFWVISGGVDMYAGAGAFSAPVSSGGPLAPFTGNPLLPYVVGSCGVYVHGEILGGLVSASAWADLSLRGPVPTYFEGTFGLQGCVAWVLCASVDITAGLNSSGFYASKS